MTILASVPMERAVPITFVLKDDHLRYAITGPGSRPGLAMCERVNLLRGSRRAAWVGDRLELVRTGETREISEDAWVVYQGPSRCAEDCLVASASCVLPGGHLGHHFGFAVAPGGGWVGLLWRFET